MSKTLHMIMAFLHGEQPTPLETALVYIVGAAASIFIVAQNLANGVTLSTLQIAILLIMALDMTGGIVANSTHSTNAWYWRRPVQLRLLFVFIHFIQPLLAVLVLDTGHWAFFWGTYLYMLAATSILLLMPSTSLQRPLAFAFYGIGVIGVIYLLSPIPVLQWFAPVYFAKLIIGFSVNHYDVQAENYASRNVSHA